jgi:NO-binding membrane sensor protein with MHYT domain
LLTALAIGIYIYQLHLINTINFAEPVLVIQERLSRLITSTLNVTRVLFLQLPLWTIFFWNDGMFVKENWAWWILNIVVTLSFTVIALWLFFNIRIENKDKRWFKLLFSGKEWKPVVESVDMLKQIEGF